MKFKLKSKIPLVKLVVRIDERMHHYLLKPKSFITLILSAKHNVMYVERRIHDLSTLH